ncbi:MAG: flagellar hook-length control protein FliK [Lachnospiraceae bacterium]
MTGKVVSEIGKPLGNLNISQMQQIPEKESNKKQQSFYEMLDKTKAHWERPAQPPQKKAETKEVVGNAYVQNKIASSGEEKKPEVNEEVMEKMGQLNGDIQNMIIENSDITMEELEQAMKDLGFNLVNLLNPTNLAQLYSNITGQESGMELLANQEFTNLLQELTVIGETFKTQTQLTTEQLTNLAETVKELLMENPQAEETPSITLSEPLGKEESAEQKTPVQEPVMQELEPKEPKSNENHVTQETSEEKNLTNPVRELVQNDTKTVVEVNTILSNEQETEPLQQPSITDTSKEVLRSQQPDNPVIIGMKMEKSVLQEGGELQPQDTQTEHTNQEADFFAKDNKNEEKDQKGFSESNLLNRNLVLNETRTAVNPIPEFMQKMDQSMDIRTVIDLIAEHARTQNAGTVSSFEMQLNPVNLGKMFVQIASNAGEITAKIITQNEIAKEAIESQVTQLKENLSQQGVKVTAVEVTIASHEFERSLTGDRDKQPTGQQKEQNKHRRNLNLNQMTLDDMSGLMSEEELAANIMLEQGNSIDITA